MAKKKKRRDSYQQPGGGQAPAEKPKTPVSESVPARPSSKPSNGSSTFRANLSWWLLGGGIVAAVVAVMVLTSLLAEDQSGVTDAGSWDLPALEEDNDPDGRVTLAEFEGKPVVLNFFASWCVNCEAELPRFRQAVRDYEDDVSVLFINSNETGNWRPMANRTGIDDQILIDDIGGSNNNGLYRSLGGTGGMPLTAFYDEDGEVVEVFRGELSADALYGRIESLLAGQA